jgi:O-antigen ligase
MVAWYGSFNEYLNRTCCTRPSFGGKVTTGVLCLAAGTVVAGTVVVGIVVAGIVVAGIVVAGIVVAGIVVAGTVAAGIVVAGIVVAGIVVAGIVVAGTVVPDEFNLTTNASSLPADVRLAVPALGSKSAVPSNSPVTYVFPEVSTATPLLRS